jgi:DNA-directed RNA polymerase specialized sigma subunit
MSSENEELSLSDAVKEEEQFVRERLKDELGREPTREEIDEWLREHTESY